MDELQPVEEQTSASNDSSLVEELFEYVEPESTPWRNNYLATVKKCYDFKELRQWGDVDRAALDEYGVPDLSVDRINRGLDFIRGTRENTGQKKKITRRELGDTRVAEILNRVVDFVEYNGDFDSVYDEAFDSLLDTGCGIIKLGYDASRREVWAEHVPTEEFAHSKCKNKDLSDISWCWEHSVKHWEEAAILFPDKAGEIKSLATTLESEYEQMAGNTQGNVTAVSKDYGSGNESVGGWDGQVSVYEFWVKRLMTYKKVGFVDQQNQPQFKLVPQDGETQEGETEVGSQIVPEWWQYIVVCGKNENSAIVVKQGKSKYDSHPYISEIAERKRSGEPRGYIEVVIPHQIRINLAWGQKVAFNNKSIKSPLVISGTTQDVIDKAIWQSKIGAIFSVPVGARIEQVNIQPNVNLQAIEEGNMARMDMDFAAAATEAPLRGVSEPGASGLKMGMQQSAAMTPLNKWVKAESKGKKTFYRKLLKVLIVEMTSAEIMRILGMEDFFRLCGIVFDEKGKIVPPGTPDPMTGKPLPPPIEFPLQVDVEEYDVVIQDQSVSDYNKQQSFNATEALVAGGVPMDDEFRINQAPIKNTDEAIQSNKRARADILRQLMAENQMLKEAVGQMQKMIPKPGSNAATGRSAPQAGKRSMMGGQNGTAGMGR